MAHEMDLEIEESWREGLALVREEIAKDPEWFIGYEYILQPLANRLWCNRNGIDLHEKLTRNYDNRPCRTDRDPPYEPGYVYLLHSGKFCFKIGKSITPDARIENIGLIVPLDIVPTRIQFTDSMSYYEGWLHRFYAHRRVKGEWFNLSFWDFLFLFMESERLYHCRDLNDNVYSVLNTIARDFEFGSVPMTSLMAGDLERKARREQETARVK